VLILSPGPDSSTGNLRIVTCNGIDVSVPAGYPFKACPHSDRLVPTVATVAGAGAQQQQGLAMHYAPNGVTRTAASAQHTTAGEDAERASGKSAKTTAHAGVAENTMPRAGKVSVAHTSTTSVISSGGGATATATGGGKP
jgi:hypothetical protein